LGPVIVKLFFPASGRPSAALNARTSNLGLPPVEDLHDAFAVLTSAHSKPIAVPIALKLNLAW
jgi:hypothetical protein